MKKRKIMKHVITPLNAGQEMNCHVKVVSAKSEAVKRAIGIAANLQAQLEGNSITCRVRRAGRGFEITDTHGPSIIVTPSGQVLDEITGNPAKF
jgi:ribosomal protein L19